MALRLPEDVVFGEATPEQQAQCCKLAASAFAAPLSEDQYVELEDFLGSRPLTASGRRRDWCLFPKNDPNLILASCKTLHRFLLVRDGHAALRQEDSYCIASVVTNPAYRNSGLASLLLSHVAEWLDGPGEAAASMLYTSIGGFYAERGWAPLPAFESVLKPGTRLARHRRSSLPATRLLVPRDIPSLCQRDVECVREEMQRKQVPENQALAVVAPTAELVTLLQDRAAFISARQVGRIIQHGGAIDQDEDSWLCWYHDFRKQQLAVLRIHVPEHSGKRPQPELVVASLLLQALDQAVEWGLPKVTVWDANPTVLGALDLLRDRYAVEVESGQRDQRSIPSLRCKGGRGNVYSLVAVNIRTMLVAGFDRRTAVDFSRQPGTERF